MGAARRRWCLLGWLLGAAWLLGCGLAAAQPEDTRGPRLTLTTLTVKFLTPAKVQVAGSATPSGMHFDQTGQYGQLEVGLQLADTLAGFPVLVDCAASVPEEYLGGATRKRVMLLYSKGQEVPAGPGVCTGAGWFRGWRLYDHLLRYPNPLAGDPGDDGRHFAFDATQALGTVKPTRYYQVVVCVRHSWDVLSGRGTGFNYTWVVYGPFPWGQAPPFAGPLTASARVPARFSGQPLTAGGGTSVGGTPPTMPPPAAPVVKPRPGTPRVVVDGQPVTGPRAPAFIKGTLMAPMMAFVQAANLQLGYARDARRVMIMHGPMLQMWVGKSVAKLGDRQIPLSTPPVIVSGEVYLPLRFTVEALGGALKWDAATQTATVTIPRG